MSNALEVETSAVRLLAAREHSARELRDKLLRKHSDGELVTSVLEDLQRRNLLSDERFTEQYVDMRMRKGYGPLRIRAELIERGIAGDLIDLWLDDTPSSWLSQLADVARGKFGASRPADAKDQAKQARFLQHRGFPESLIRRYLWD